MNSIKFQQVKGDRVMTPRRGISGRCRLNEYTIRDICERAGVEYTTTVKLSAVLAKAVENAGVVGAIAARELEGRAR